MRGTNIAKVEGQWLLSNWPNCSVLKTQMTAQGSCLLSLHTSCPNSMRDHCDIIKWHHDHLLYFFSRKTTACVQRKCHNWSAHLPVSPLRFTITIATHKPHRLFLVPNFMPVTLSLQVFWCTLLPEPWIYLQHIRTDTRYKCINNKQIKNNTFGNRTILRIKTMPHWWQGNSVSKHLKNNTKLNYR